MLFASNPASILRGSAGRKIDRSKCLPIVAPYASSWRRNSASSPVRFCLSSARITLPTLPSLAGHSQSMSMPSKTPAAEGEAHPQVRVLLLEQLELVEVAGERLVELVADAVDRQARVEPALVVRPRVAHAERVGLEAAARLVHVAERVVDVGQLRRLA